MKIYPVKDIIDNQPTFEKPLNEILGEIKQMLLAGKRGQALEIKVKRKR